MLNTIASATLFHRKLGTDNALIFGVVRLEMNAKLPNSTISPTIKEGHLYPINLNQKRVETRQAFEVRDPYGEPFDVFNMHDNIGRKIWPTVEQHSRSRLDNWFYALLTPLEDLENQYFIYAALDTQLFDEDDGDSWHQLTKANDTWQSIEPLSDSFGESDQTLARRVPWPINGDEYHIEPSPLTLLKIRHYFRTFYLEVYRDGGDRSQCKDAARAGAIKNGFSEQLVDSILYNAHSIYQEDEFMDFLDIADEFQPYKPKIAMLASEYQARQAAMNSVKSEQRQN